MTEIPNLILREYDIRGTVGKNLDEAIAYQVGRRFAVAAQAENRGAVVVCRDGRLSSQKLSDAVVAGIRVRGVDVIDIGVGPTPMLYFAVQKLVGVAGGIMVTGSHNPPEDNGFKMTLKSRPFFGSDIQNMAQLTVPAVGTQMGQLDHSDVRQEYADRILQALDGCGKKSLKIAWNPGHGAAAEIVQLLTAKGGIPGKHFLLNAEIDGTFPAHHPDPTVPENLQQLITQVRAENCDVGIAFDGDGDRIGVVDGHGRIVWGDQLLTLLARDVLKHSPGATIIADVKASQTLFEEVLKLKGNPIMWRTGHSLIKSKIYETGAKLAGEMSGHIFFNDEYYGYDDGPYAAVRLIRILLNSEKSLAELYDGLPKLVSTPEMRIGCSDDKKFKVVEAITSDLKETKQEVVDVDGVRVHNKDGWWLIRASNTQAALVARAEGRCDKSLQKLLKQMQGHLEKYGVVLA